MFPPSFIRRSTGFLSARRGAVFLAAIGCAALVATATGHSPDDRDGPPPDGQDVFRYDTFGDERQWTDQLKMHTVIENSLDPVTALSLGLKVDADALPDGLQSIARRRSSRHSAQRPTSSRTPAAFPPSRLP